MFYQSSGRSKIVSEAAISGALSIMLLITCSNYQIGFAQQLPVNHIAAPATASTKSPALAHPVAARSNLDLLIELALQHNPEIKVMQRNYDMMRARIPQAKALPDPMFTLGYLGNITPIPPFDIQKSDPASARMFSFTQEIPYPGKLLLKGKMAAMSADSEWWSYQQTRLNIRAAVKDAYYELCYLNKAIDTIEKNKELVEKFARIAEASYAVGKGIQQDVLKAHVEISKLIEQLSLLEQRKLTAEAVLNSLLYRELETPVDNLAELVPFEFLHTLDGLKEIALASSPALKMQQRKIAREQYGIELAKKDFYPDLSISLTYQNRPGMPEMYGINFGIKLPLYFRQKQLPALTEAAAGAAMERKRLDNTTIVLCYKIKEKYLALKNSQKLIELYGSVIIPQSSLALESAIAGYSTGKVDFLTLLDNITTLLNYELSYYEQLSNAEKAVAAMEPLVGETLQP